MDSNWSFRVQVFQHDDVAHYVLSWSLEHVIWTNPKINCLPTWFSFNLLYRKSFTFVHVVSNHRAFHNALGVWNEEDGCSDWDWATISCLRMLYPFSMVYFPFFVPIQTTSSYKCRRLSGMARISFVVCSSNKLLIICSFHHASSPYVNSETSWGSFLFAGFAGPQLGPSSTIYLYECSPFFQSPIDHITKCDMVAHPINKLCQPQEGLYFFVACHKSVWLKYSPLSSLHLNALVFSLSL